MKKIEEGDIVYCIKNVHHNNNGVTSICHKCGELYKTTSESHDFNAGSYLYIETEKCRTRNDQLGFFIEGDKDSIFDDWLFFSDHFVVSSVKYLRLKKLEKLKKL